MKKTVRVTAALSLFLFSYQSSFAQFTILPGTSESSEVCEQLLASYEASGIVPKGSAVAAAKMTIASTKYDQISEQLAKDPNKDECEKTPGTITCQDYEEKKKEQEQAQADKDAAFSEAAKANLDRSERDTLLGCAIKTGRVTLQMAPFFVTYVANFLLALVGIITILFIVIGGYYYIYGGLVDEKEKGKKTIIHALMGMGIALLAWAAVSAIITAVTG